MVSPVQFEGAASFPRKGQHAAKVEPDECRLWCIEVGVQDLEHEGVTQVLMSSGRLKTSKIWNDLSRTCFRRTYAGLVP